MSGQKSFGSRFHIAVQQDFAVAAHHADIHTAGVQVDTTIKWVLIRVTSHAVSSCLRHFAFSHYQHTIVVG